MSDVKAVILSAGKGTRWIPLTLAHQKSVYKVGPFSILEHNLDQLQGLVKEAVIIVKHKKEEVMSLVGDSYKDIKIRYVLQKRFLGTADAAKAALPFLGSRFILLNGDDLYDKADIKNCLKKFPCLLLFKAKSNFSSFGQVITKEDRVEGIKEKPKRIISNLVNTGLYFLGKEIFNYKIKKSSRGELEFTDYLKNLIKDRPLYFFIAKKWLPVSYNWDLLKAGEFFSKNKKFPQPKNHFSVGSNVLLKGPVYIGNNVVIEENCSLEGNTFIGDNSLIGQGSVIKNSIIGESTLIGRNNYIVNSIIGKNCNLGDEVSVFLPQAGNNKGVILADFSKIGRRVTLESGTVVWPHISVKSGQVVRGNIG